MSTDPSFISVCLILALVFLLRSLDKWSVGYTDRIKMVVIPKIIIKIKRMKI